MIILNLIIIYGPHIYLTPTFQNNVCFVIGIFFFENCKRFVFFLYWWVYDCIDLVSFDYVG